MVEKKLAEKKVVAVLMVYSLGERGLGKTPERSLYCLNTFGRVLIADPPDLERVPS